MRARTNKRMPAAASDAHNYTCKTLQGHAESQRATRQAKTRSVLALRVPVLHNASSSHHAHGGERLVSLSLFSPSPVSRYFLSFSNTALWQIYEYVREVVKQRNELEKHDTCNLIARGEVDGTICRCGASVQALPQKVAIE